MAIVQENMAQAKPKVEETTYGATYVTVATETAAPEEVEAEPVEESVPETPETPEEAVSAPVVEEKPKAVKKPRTSTKAKK